MKYIDNFLNSITMYRLVLYGLLLIALLGIAFGFTGVLHMSGLSMSVSLVILIAIAAVTNILLGKLFKIPINDESSYITAVILFLILPPATTVFSGLILALAAVLAMSSKFILNLKGKHIFNPAGIAALVLGFGGLMFATWWVGSTVMLPVVLIFGLLLTKKLRRFDTMFFIFTGIALIAMIGTGMWYGSSLYEAAKSAILSSPLIFFGTVMLTEPITSPTTRGWRMIYAALVALLFGLPYHIGPLHSTPELALIIGNLFTYIVGPKQKLILRLKEKLQLAPAIFDFTFVPNQQMSFVAGQYMEWTLGHTKSDTRGNRRYFTIASAPTEQEIHIGVKIPQNSSTFKKALSSMKPGDQLLAGQLSGDFQLPKDSNTKIVGIAGGVGITPFRSMIKSMVDKNEKRDFVLFYMCADPSEFVYTDIFDSARDLGVKPVYVVSGSKENPSALANWQGKTGYLTKELVEAEVSDYKNRIYYLSGPSAMVTNYKKLLLSMGVSRFSIKTDYFPGY